ncbi:PilZ domain-containing protein [Acidipila rosea]|nr:PilZ domain-containing protein [Acidipila rosea]MBW4026648.1 PilZ domain-containing protein [Acidobacteriota bacterium]
MPPVIQQEPPTGVRCAVRFPLQLSARVIALGVEYQAFTENISASGVLFRMQQELPVDVPIDFLIEVPATVLSGQSTAAVHCLGRVVRSYYKAPSAYVAAVIDEYRFQ